MTVSSEVKTPLMYSNLNTLLLDVFEKYSDSTLFLSANKEYGLTYRDVKERVSSCSRYIDKLNIKEERVLVALGNSPDFFIVFLSLLISNIQPVILNPGLSGKEVSDIGLQVETKWLITDVPEILSELKEKEAGFNLVNLSEIKSYQGGQVSLPARRLSTKNIAYIVFSSGSTGRPKGVCISEENMLFEIEAMNRAYNFEENKNHLCVLPLYHASALYRSVFLPFINGCTVVMANGFEKDKFWTQIEEYDIRFVQVVPTILWSLLSINEKPSAKVKENLKFIGSASAYHPPELVDKFENEIDIPLAQGYGLTETTCGAFLNHPDGRTLDSRYSVGKPLEGTKVRIVDEKGVALSPGQTGEVIINGPHVTSGYLNSDEQDGKRIHGDELSTEDIGYLDEKGFLYLIGRKSEIIHRGGYKITPSEVERVILKYPGIKNVIVFGVPHELLGEDIVAYVDLEGENDEGAIRVFIGQTLPRHMVPSRVIDKPEEFLVRGVKISRAKLKENYLKENPRTSGNAGADSQVQVNAHHNPRAFKYNDTVYIRPLMEADVQSDIYRDNIMNPEVQFYTYSGRFPQSEFEINRYWSTVHLPDAMAFAICDAKTDEYVGNLALRIDWVARLGEFGRMIFLDYQYRPYSIKSMELLLQYAFDDLRLHKLFGGGANPRSVPSLVRLGFQIEGRLKKHHFLKGEWRDIFHVGLLREDYELQKRENNNSRRKELSLPDHIYTPVKDCMNRAFGTPVENIYSFTSPADIKEWDSLGMVALWSMLEEKFAIKLSSSDMITVSDVTDLVFLIDEKIQKVNK